MKINRKFSRILLIATILFFAVSFSAVFARSGCCSSHGGVCGCGCCDGSSLSATCAPYYPSCQRATPANQQIQQVAPKIIIPSATRISEFNQAMEYTNSLQGSYIQNPDGFRERLVLEMVKKYKTLKLDNIGLMVYSTLQDIK